MFDRIITPIIALGLGFLVWVYIRSRDQEQYEHEIPLTVQLASNQNEQFELERDEPYNVPVSFAGPPSRIREVRNLVRQGTLKLHQTVVIPDEKAQDTRLATLEVPMRIDLVGLSLPTGVQAVIPEYKSRLQIGVRRIIQKRMPIKLQHTGEQALDRITIEPSSVLVRGPKEVLDLETAIPTQLYIPRNDLKNDQGDQVVAPFQLNLVNKLGGAIIHTEPSSVRVSLVVKGPRKIHELKDVPVHFLCPANFPFRPRFTSDQSGLITLRVRGPNTEVKPVVSAYVNLTVRKFQSGLHAEEPIRIELPPGYELAQDPPRLSSFQLDPIDLPTIKPD